MKLFSRKLHAWAGVSTALFILLLSITGILLNHANILNVNNKVSDYTEQNPLKMLALSNDAWVIATEYKLIFTGPDFIETKDLFFPHNTKYIIELIEYENQLYVFLESGIIYTTEIQNIIWERIQTPEINYMYDAQISHGNLSILTDFGIFNLDLEDRKWNTSISMSRKTSLKDIIKGLHTGYYFAPFLKSFNSLATLAMIFLTCSGIAIFLKTKR